MVNNRNILFRSGHGDDEVTTRNTSVTVCENACKFLGA